MSAQTIGRATRPLCDIGRARKLSFYYKVNIKDNARRSSI